MSNVKQQNCIYQTLNNIFYINTEFNHNEFQFIIPKYKLTLWDVKKIFGCQLKNKDNLLLYIEVANPPNKKVIVRRNDINGSTLTRGDIFVRFYKMFGVKSIPELMSELYQKINKTVGKKRLYSENNNSTLDDSEGKILSITDIVEPPKKKQKIKDDSIDWNTIYSVEKIKIERMIHIYKQILNNKDNIKSIDQCYNTIKLLRNNKTELFSINDKIKNEINDLELSLHANDIMFKSIQSKYDCNAQIGITLKSDVDTVQRELKKIDDEIERLKRKKSQLTKKCAKLNDEYTNNSKAVKEFKEAIDKTQDSMNIATKMISKTKPLLPIIEAVIYKHDNILKTLSDDISKYQQNWSNWDSNSVLSWLRCIQKYNDTKIDVKLTENVMNNNIKGIDLINLNDLSLRMMGIDNNYDRNTILHAIKTLIL